MKTVITYGTFDLFHQGHYNILKRAKEAGDYLIVGVTGETYDNERGKLSVQDSLAVRIENVKKTGFADKIIVEEYLGQKISDIQKYHVDVFVIGSDWKGKFDHLNKYCEVKYLERTKDISSTMLREKNSIIYRLGIATDTLNDEDSVSEIESVSGIHVESVFSNDLNIAKGFKEKYELLAQYDDYDAFLESVDIVYIKTSFEDRYKLARKAVEKSKHVICDSPFSFNGNEVKEIKSIAKKNNVVFLENVPMLYQHAFGQLLWMARGNLIGDIVKMHCSITEEMVNNQDTKALSDLCYYAICSVVKIFGVNCISVENDTIRDENGEIIYIMIRFKYDNSVAIAEISKKIDIRSGLRIVGTSGTIEVPDDWWRVGYFKMKQNKDDHAKRYSSNFDGNGFRYLVQTLIREIRSESRYSVQISDEEAMLITDIVSKLV